MYVRLLAIKLSFGLASLYFVKYKLIISCGKLYPLPTPMGKRRDCVNVIVLHKSHIWMKRVTNNIRSI